MQFTKMQGAGNDFVMIETNDVQHDWSRLAVAMCDRHLGIGADGLLVLSSSDVAHIKMRTFDADGSEAETCGNGIRCVARYVLQKGLVDAETEQISVETIPGISKIQLYREDNKLVKIQASMGKPRFYPEEIPVVINEGEERIVRVEEMLRYTVVIDGTDLLLNLISMGNPHAVCFLTEPVSGFPLSQLGPKVENLSIFPNRTNFEVARVLNRRKIEARVWERGVGETLACGTGACAITVAAQLLGDVDDKVNIRLPGGALGVEWDRVGEVFLNGPAETVFTGEWPD